MRRVLCGGGPSFPRRVRSSSTVRLFTAKPLVRGYCSSKGNEQPLPLPPFNSRLVDTKRGLAYLIGAGLVAGCSVVLAQYLNPVTLKENGIVEDLIITSLDPLEGNQSEALARLSLLAVNNRLSKLIARRLKFDKLIQSLQGKNETTLMNAANLTNVLSYLKSNAPYLVNEQTASGVLQLLMHPNPALQSIACRFLVNVSETKEEIVLKLLPCAGPLYQVYKQRGDVTSIRHSTLGALHNMLLLDSSDQGFLQWKEKMLQDISEEDRETIVNYQPDTMGMYRTKSAASATILGVIWGTLRSSIQVLRKTGSDVSVLKKVVGRSALLSAAGSLVLWATLHAEYLLVPPVFDKVMMRKNGLEATVGSLGVLNGLILWLHLGVAPFSFLPAAAYPIFHHYMYGTHILTEDAEDL